MKVKARVTEPSQSLQEDRVFSHFPPPPPPPPFIIFEQRRFFPCHSACSLSHNSRPLSTPANADDHSNSRTMKPPRQTSHCFSRVARLSQSYESRITEALPCEILTPGAGALSSEELLQVYVHMYSVHIRTRTIHVLIVTASPESCRRTAQAACGSSAPPRAHCVDWP
jgi:hypothetical protein